MKKKLYFGILLAVSATTLLSYSSGTPGGRTGSPGDLGNTCVGCHTGTEVTSQDNWITSNIPAEGYTPGDTYTFTATGTHSGAAKFGFEITSENGSSKVGTFIATDENTTQLYNGSEAITHTSDNAAVSGTKEWSFDWTAPTEGTGDVTFYGAFNAANGDEGSSGDVIYTSELAVSESTVSVNENNFNIISIGPNPAKDILIINSNELIRKISLYNISGKRVLELSNVNANSKKINLESFATGIYFLNIKGENFNKLEKFIIK